MTTNNCLIPLMTPGLGFEPGPPILVVTLAAPKKLLASYNKSCVLLTLKGGIVYYLNKLRYFVVMYMYTNYRFYLTPCVA